LTEEQVREEIAKAQKKRLVRKQGPHFIAD